jgi:uncharacterized membrane-anchored protein
MRRVFLAGLAVLVLAVVNRAIWEKEQVLSKGTTVLVELGRADPRSLIQGDYMRLWYNIPEEVRLEIRESRRDGKVVVALDERGVARVLRIPSEDESLTKDEHLLSYKYRGGRIYLGARSFFFQEGHAGYYASARFGEMRVAGNGDSVLVGLRGQDLQRLGPEEPKAGP